MWAEGKVRIIDIATDLGVSTATVSNVIHGKTKKISPQTVKRVQEALERRGYIPNMAATLLAQNDSRIIGVVVNNHAKYEGRLLMDPFVAGAVNYLSDAIEENGWFMMVKKANSIMEAAKFASMWNMDGMVLLGFCEDDYQLLRDSIRIPFVVYDGAQENGSRFCNTCIDNRDGDGRWAPISGNWAINGCCTWRITGKEWTFTGMKGCVMVLALQRTIGKSLWKARSGRPFMGPKWRSCGSLPPSLPPLMPTPWRSWACSREPEFGSRRI